MATGTENLEAWCLRYVSRQTDRRTYGQADGNISHP